MIYIDARSSEDVVVLASGSTMLGLHSMARNKPFSMDKTGFQTLKAALNSVSTAHTYQVHLSVRLGMLNHFSLCSHGQNSPGTPRMIDITQNNDLSKLVPREGKQIKHSSTSKIKTANTIPGAQKQCLRHQDCTVSALPKKPSRHSSPKLHHKPFTIPTAPCHHVHYTRTSLKSRSCGPSTAGNLENTPTKFKYNIARGRRTQSKMKKKNFRRDRLQVPRTKGNKVSAICKQNTLQGNAVCTEEVPNQVETAEPDVAELKLERCTHNGNANLALCPQCKVVWEQSLPYESTTKTVSTKACAASLSCSNSKNAEEEAERDSSNRDRKKPIQDHKNDVPKVDTINKGNIVELVNLVSTRAVLSQVVGALGGTDTSFIASAMQEGFKGLLVPNSRQQSALTTLGSLLSQQLCKAVIEIGEKNKIAPDEPEDKKICSEIVNEKVNHNSNHLDHQPGGENNKCGRHLNHAHAAVQTVASVHDTRDTGSGCNQSESSQQCQKIEQASQLVPYKVQIDSSVQTQEQEDVVPPENIVDMSSPEGMYGVQKHCAK